MTSKADVQAVVAAFMAQRGCSMRQIARKAGLAPSTLAHMMEENPSYRGKPDAWVKLARYRELGLDEAEVLAALDFLPPPAVREVEPDPIDTIARMLRQLGVDADEAAPIMLHVQGAAARARASESRNVVSQ